MIATGTVQRVGTGFALEENLALIVTRTARVSMKELANLFQENACVLMALKEKTARKVKYMAFFFSPYNKRSNFWPICNFTR